MHKSRLLLSVHGMTISFPIIKLLQVAGTGITEADLVPLSIGCSVIETVPSFRYLVFLSSVMAKHHWM